LSDIDRIVIWNRTDGGVGTRLVNFRVVVLGNDRKPVWETKVTDPPIPHVQLELAGPATVTIKGASADFDQPGFPVAKAIDSDATAKSGWGIFPQTGKSHVAVFQLTQPIRTDVNGSLTVTLNQSFGSEHTIGRFRLAVTQSPQPLGAVPSHIGEILAIGAEQRTSDQVDELARYYRSVAPELQALRMQITRLERELKELDKLVPLIPVMRDLPADKRRTTHVLLKSNFLLPGDPVDPVVPAIFPPMPDDLARNRLGLARWLVSPDNPLSARVAANRFWSQLMGSGLVETEEDFGTQGSAPSHPELLDWLALEFMEPLGAATNEAQTWDVKRLIRQIVTSATYRQSSKGSRVGSSIDPDNRLLSRGPRQRLEAEMVRDQALALAGLLSRKIGGPSVYPPQPAGLWRAAFNGERTWATSSGEDRYRRGVYTFWRRTVPYPSMATFDAPSREICTVRRLPTNTPLQAFVTLNDPVYVEAAQALARRIAQEGGTTLEQRAAYGLQLCLCRPPTGEQVAELVELVRTEAMHFQQDNGGARDLAASPDGRLPDGVDMAELAAWTVASNVLLNLDGVLSKR
jgi:hypothetical protein